MAVTFTTTILKDDNTNATGIVIPAEAMAALGPQKRPRVIVSLNGYTYRSTVAVFGTVFMLGLSQARREESGLRAGDPVEVILDLDREPPTLAVPADLRAALAAQAGASAAFDTLAFSRRKEWSGRSKRPKRRKPGRAGSPGSSPNWARPDRPRAEAQQAPRRAARGLLCPRQGSRGRR